MPIYEYQCTACQHQLEAFQKFSDEPLKECPECGKPELQKLISSSAFHLKGGGWYVTDIRDKNKKNPDAAADAGASPPADKPADKATDAAKPEPSTPADKKTSGTSSSSTDSSTG